MLGSAQPATATIHTTISAATPTSPTRSSRLRRLSYLRSYTHNHLHSHLSATFSRVEAPPLTRTTSSPAGGSSATSPPPSASHALDTPSATEAAPNTGPAHIQSGEHGWVPTVQGRSGLDRSTTNPTSTSTHPASPEPPTSMSSRSRAATVLGPTPASILPTSSARRASAAPHSFSNTSMPESSSLATPSKDLNPTIRFIPHLEPRSSARPSLQFTALTRTLKSPTQIVKVGRYSERDAQAANAHNPDSSTADVLPVGFKSKVVSRRHCEFWCSDGQWYVKDVKSSSGTFLNHVRLSSPGMESRPYPVNDGDVVQLGIDFKGGEEVIFRCVKIRVECNRGWQKGLNQFNTSTHKRLLKQTLTKRSRDSDAASVNSSECSICLNPVAPCQALFVAPCSHVWHYKCVRNLIHGPSWPNFLCPNCRFVADLDADVEPPEDFDEDLYEETSAMHDGDEAGEDARVDADFELSDGEEDEASGGADLHDAGHADGEEGRREGAERLDVNQRNANIADAELAELLHRTSVNSPSPSPSAARSRSRGQRRDSPSRNPYRSKAHGQTGVVSPSSSTQPVNISHSAQPERPSSNDLLGASPRSTTPTTTAQFALAAGVIMGNGPMTPRNDAGPFVLDGSGGGAGSSGPGPRARGFEERIAGPLLREEGESGLGSR